MRFIKTIRNRLGLSQSALARKIGVTYHMVQCAEGKDQTRMSLDSLVRLWKVSGLTADDFMWLLSREFGCVEAEKDSAKKKAR